MKTQSKINRIKKKYKKLRNMEFYYINNGWGDDLYKIQMKIQKIMRKHKDILENYNFSLNYYEYDYTNW